MILRSVLVASYLLAMLMFTHAYKLKTLPFEVLIAAGALLLFRWDKVFFRRGLYLLLIVSVAVGLDYQLNTTYLENVLNELQYSTATGLLSGGTAIAILVALAGCLLVIFWPLNNPARRYRLRHTDLSAFVFAGLAVATFDVQHAVSSHCSRCICLADLLGGVGSPWTQIEAVAQRRQQLTNCFPGG